MKNFRFLVLALFVAAITGLGSARADTFAYSFSGPGMSGSITLTASLVLPGEYLVTNVTGVTDGLAITSILAPGTYPIGTGFPANDNLLFPSSSTAIFDVAGLSYLLAGGIDFNIYHLGSGYDYAIGATGGGLITSIGPTPEPASLWLLATGALGVAGVVRRRPLV